MVTSDSSGQHHDIDHFASQVPVQHNGQVQRKRTVASLRIDDTGLAVSMGGAELASADFHADVQVLLPAQSCNLHCKRIIWKQPGGVETQYLDAGLQRSAAI